MDVMVGGGSTRSSTFAVLGSLLKNGMMTVAERKSSIKIKTDPEISSTKPLLTGAMKDVVEALRYGHRFKPQSFVAATGVSLDDFQAISEHVESMGRRCELIQGEVVVRCLSISAQHEGAMEAFRRTFNEMTMQAGTYYSFVGQGSAALQPGGHNEIEADASFAPKKRRIRSGYLTSKTKATIAFEVAYGNETLKNLKMKMDLYMQPTSVVQIVIGVKLPFKPKMLLVPGCECTILYAEKAPRIDGSDEEPGKGRSIERKVVMNNPDFGPEDPDFPGFPNVILPNNLLFEGVEDDEPDAPDHLAKFHSKFVVDILKAGIHRFNFEGLIAEMLENFRTNADLPCAPQSIRMHPYQLRNNR